MEEFKWTQKARRSLGEIVARCWVDAGFKRKFVSHPKQVLRTFGVKLSGTLTPMVLEIRGITEIILRAVETNSNSAKKIFWILLPPPPPEVRPAPRRGTARMRDRVTAAPGTVILTIGNVTIWHSRKSKDGGQ